MERSVVVQPTLKTSISGIYAAGDIAWPEPHPTRTVRIEHWMVAKCQGRLAARNILGHARLSMRTDFSNSQLDVHSHAEGDIATKYKSRAVCSPCSIYRDLAIRQAELMVEQEVMD